MYEYFLPVDVQIHNQHVTFISVSHTYAIGEANPLCIQHLTVQLSSCQTHKTPLLMSQCTTTASLTLTCWQHIHCTGYQVTQQSHHPTLVGTRVKGRVKLGECQLTGSWSHYVITTSRCGLHICSIQEASGPKHM